MKKRLLFNWLHWLAFALILYFFFVAPEVARPTLDDQRSDLLSTHVGMGMLLGGNARLCPGNPRTRVRRHDTDDLRASTGPPLAKFRPGRQCVAHHRTKNAAQIFVTRSCLGARYTRAGEQLTTDT